MRTYLVTYDLMAPGKDYTVFIRKLEQLGARRAQLSTWWVASALTADALRDTLRVYCDLNDRILVVEAGHWASFNALSKPRAA